MSFVTMIYLFIVLCLVLCMITHVFRTEKALDKISIAVVLVMFILRLFMIK